MKLVKIEDVSKTKKKLTLEIAPEDMEAQREEAYAELGKQAALPGFRPGKVPRRMLEWRFDKEVRKEAFGEALQKGFETYTKENELEVVGSPDIEDEDIEKAQERIMEEAVEITVGVEVIPPFTPAPYTEQEYEIEDLVVDEKLIDRMIENSRSRSAYFVTVDDRKSRKGDFLVVDIRSTRDGADEAGLTAERTLLRGVCEGERPDPLEEGFLDREKGETFEFDFTLPDDHPLYKADGVNEIHAVGKVHQINERHLPPLDDEFAIDQGFKDLEEYRQSFREGIEGRRAAALEDRKREAVIERLVEKTEIFVPTSMTQWNYYRMKFRREQENRQYGRSDADLTSEEKSALEAETLYEAERSAKERLVLKKIADLEKIEVSDDEYYAEMSQIARRRGEKNIDRFLAQIDRDGLEDSYKESIQIEKTVNWLVEHNQFKVIEPKGSKK